MQNFKKLSSRLQQQQQQLKQQQQQQQKLDRISNQFGVSLISPRIAAIAMIYAGEWSLATESFVLALSRSFMQIDMSRIGLLFSSRFGRSLGSFQG